MKKLEKSKNIPRCFLITMELSEKFIFNFSEPKQNRHIKKT